MTLNNWKGKTLEEANKELVSLREELFNLRLKKVTGQLEKLHRLSQVKREIARAHTYIGALGSARS